MEQEMKKIKYDDLEDLYLSIHNVREKLQLYREMSPECFTPGYLDALIKRMFEIENKIDVLQNYTKE
jgi:hypothetical protein